MLTIRRVAACVMLFVLAAVTLSPAQAASLFPDPTSLEGWSPYVLQPGETTACLARRAGVDRATLAAENRTANPDLLTAGQTVTLPALEPGRPIMLGAGDTPAVVALREDLSLWEVMARTAGPFYLGRSIVLQGQAEPGPCLPYPVVAFELSPTPLTRGRVALLSLETAVPATCEVTYLGRTEPCYRDADGRLRALIAVSALEEPGTYPLVVALASRGVTSDLELWLEVTSGHYGYQVITPTPSLSGLMDPELMQSELDYLAPWREVRMAERLWDFPLAFPLAVVVPTSADYGDRRSYGGLVDGYHSGVDYRAWTGLAVLAPADGVVLMAEPLVARGNAVLIDHGWGLVTGYWHLSRIDVQVGQHVQRGEAFAAAGNTGLSTGSHLHWELWVNGVSVDARQWLEPEGLFGIAPRILEALDPGASASMGQ